LSEWNKGYIVGFFVVNRMNQVRQSNILASLQVRITWTIAREL